MTNCPNCGAPITGDVCEYCGTVFNDTPKSKYNELLDYQYNQLKQVQRNLEVQLAMDEIFNHIKQQQMETCHNILNGKRNLFTHLKKKWQG